MRIEDFIEETNKATDVDTLFAVYTRFMEHYGFDRVLFALINDHAALHKEAEHGVVKNYPEEWITHYLKEGYDKIDPVRHHALMKVDAFTWDDLFASTKLSDRQKKLRDESTEAGLYSGIGVPLRGPGGAIAGMGAASSEKDKLITPHVMSIVSLISHQFYHCFWRLMEKSPTPPKTVLSAREKDILLYTARGISRAEIADKLNISPHTVDYHIRSIFKKLDVQSMISAVVKAIKLGQIDP